MTQAARRSASALAVLTLFVLTAPTPPASITALRSAPGAGPLVGAVALLGWTVVGWLLLVTALSLLARLPAHGGMTRRLARAARGAVCLIAPRSVRATVAVLAGGTLLLSSPASASALGGAPAGAVTDVLPASLDWPRESRSSPADADAPDAPPEAPADVGVTAVAPSRPAAQLPAPSASPARAQAPLSGHLATPGVVEAITVAPGASLWRITRERLGPEATAADVTREWPRWWHANRALIGDDPDLIRPGMRLTPPPSTAGPPH